MKAKYIIVEQAGLELPVIFSELMVHADVARGVGGKVLGAGFCYTVDDQWRAYGESTSLDVKSRGEVDSKIMNRLLTFQG